MRKLNFTPESDSYLLARARIRMTWTLAVHRLSAKKNDLFAATVRAPPESVALMPAETPASPVPDPGLFAAPTQFAEWAVTAD
jgi:hypothetical protein